jgi:HD superfamily phosphodiesterase
MTLDEAHSILNAKSGEKLEHILRVCLVCSRIEREISDDTFFPLEL